MVAASGACRTSGLGLSGCGALFLDASLLTREFAQEIELSTTHFTNLVHLDAFDVR